MFVWKPGNAFVHCIAAHWLLARPSLVSKRCPSSRPVRAPLWSCYDWCLRPEMTGKKRRSRKQITKTERWQQVRLNPGPEKNLPPYLIQPIGTPWATDALGRSWLPTSAAAKPTGGQSVIAPANSKIICCKWLIASDSSRFGSIWSTLDTTWALSLLNNEFCRITGSTCWE